MPAIRKACEPKCTQSYAAYQSCLERVAAKGVGACDGQYFDFLHCIDKCVRVDCGGLLVLLALADVVVSCVVIVGCAVGPANHAAPQVNMSFICTLRSLRPPLARLLHAPLLDLSMRVPSREAADRSNRTTPEKNYPANSKKHNITCIDGFAVQTLTYTPIHAFLVAQGSNWLRSASQPRPRAARVPCAYTALVVLWCWMTPR
ncbi:hypothetical protein BBJ28_00025172 [Nothophytophthora sp. Chile5]|nr:hypothetical protein BBJ28_00025172 [Nothophytophthora sp. Chile5]